MFDRFPEFPPFSGAYDDVIPHLTIGVDQPVERLRRAARSVQADLPVRTRITKATLMQGSNAPGSWTTVAEFPLTR